MKSKLVTCAHRILVKPCYGMTKMIAAEDDGFISIYLLEVLSLTKDHHHQAVSERFH